MPTDPTGDAGSSLLGLEDITFSVFPSVCVCIVRVWFLGSASFSIRVKFLVLVRGLVSGGVAHLLSHGAIANLIEAHFQPFSSLLAGPLLQIILGAFHFCLKIDRPWLPEAEALYYYFLFLTLS